MLRRACSALARPRWPGASAPRALASAPALAAESAPSAAPSGSAATSLSEIEEEIRTATARWVDAEVAPRVRAMDDAAALDPAVLRGLFDNGFMGVEIDEEYGGAGLNFTSSLLVVEEIARADPSVAVLVDIQNTLVNNMFRFWASEPLKAEWLPRLATDTASSFALSEPGSGSDAFALRTRADRSADGGHYTLNGAKAWISNSAEAGVFLVMANVDASKGYKGITCFVVPRETPGLVVEAKEDKLGIRASSTCALSLVDVKVPASAVLGEVGAGYKYAIEILNEGRIGIGAQMVGLARGAFDHAMPYILTEREQFGVAVGDFQGMQHQYAQAATEIEAARTLCYNAARKKEAGLPFVKDAAMVKLFTSQVAERTASRCIEWLGGVGFTKAYLSEKYFRDSKIGAIYEGTSNIQLQTIAKIVASDIRSQR